MSTQCPFCRHDPYEYVDIGVGYQAVAVTCCEFGQMLFDDRTEDGRATKLAEQILEELGDSDENRMQRADDIFHRLCPDA